MKGTGSSKQKNVPKARKNSAVEKTAESKNLIVGQIKLEDLEQERLEVRKAGEKKSTSKKQVEKKSVSEVQAAEAVAVEPQPEVQAAEEPKPEVQAAEVTAESKTKTTRTRASKKEDKEKAPGKEPKSTTAKDPEKEPKTRNTTKAATTEKIILQIGGREDLAMTSLIDRVKAAYVAEGHKADSIKNIDVYIKIDENMAYYVIDGYASGISLY